MGPDEYPMSDPPKILASRRLRDEWPPISEEEVLLSTSLKQFWLDEEEQGLPWVGSTTSSGKSDTMSETILAQARQTGARCRLIEDAALLAEVGGVGASLRYRN